VRVIIDGVPVEEESASISVFDWGLQRGFGCFEVIRSYGGKAFRRAGHLDRLERSLSALHIDPPVRPELDEWVSVIAAEGGDCLVRVMVTEGARDDRFTPPSRTIVLWESLPPVPPTLRLLPMTASWHPGSSNVGFHGVKWLSYAPNMAASDRARRAGFDDALLSSRDGWLLEGPTFTIAWVRGGVVETPSLELGILASITREVLVETTEELGISLKTGAYPLQRLETADEVMALSTVKEVTPVAALGDREVAQGPVAARLREAHRRIVERELGRS
jgi:branched-subunit amino acid aminotransferase/4-amino-4-deoxychorismate lyase